ncbi:MAG: 30S ribosomal protein S8 [candidate division Zixibacteria bacterium RBG_16_50_21]|nr:MAG: 30S ribosomal protein S8 [candidate division Zixibacteria bacterium RBG_16_50_21]
MNVTDPVADMLTRIRNGLKARQKSVDIPSSKLKREIARVLLESRLIKNFVEVPNPRQNLLRVFLGYTPGKKAFLTGIIRLSRPGLRVYLTKDQLQKMSQTMGMLIISTSRGVLTDQKAREKKVGGEVLCRVW